MAKPIRIDRHASRRPCRTPDVLRQGVRFHTGRCCLTAEDVVYSIGRTVTAGLAASYVFGRFLTKPFTQIQAVDQ